MTFPKLKQLTHQINVHNYIDAYTNLIILLLIIIIYSHYNYILHYI